MQIGESGNMDVSTYLGYSWDQVGTKLALSWHQVGTKSVN